MFIWEFVNDQGDQQNANLVTALTLLKGRNKDSGQNAPLQTQSVINLVRHSDPNFNYDSLVAANNSNDAVKNLIKDMNQDEITLKSDQEDDESIENDVTKKGGNTNTVANMAKSALNKRI